MNRPAVSIVMPTFNSADTLPRAIESVADQTFGDWELIVIDDGSTDETPRITEAYASRLGSRFLVCRQAHHGCCRARNLGIDRASGEYVAFLDADDAFAPTKLERQLTLFDRCPDLGLAFSDYACIDLTGHRIDSAFDHFYQGVRALATTEIGPGLYTCEGSIFDALLRGYFIATIVGLVRRSVLAEDIRFAEDLPYAHEWLFYLQAVKRCRAGFVDEPLSIHHYTNGSITRCDAEQNLRHLHDLLMAMPAKLAPLSHRQRCIIADHRADTSRRLGSIAYRKGDYGGAAHWFGNALRHAPNPRNLYDLLDASLHRTRRVRRDRRPSVEPKDNVGTAR